MVTLLNNGLSRTVITNIPVSLGGNGVVPAKDSLSKLVEIVPPVRQRIDFDSDVWDFTPYFALVNSEYHVYRFTNYPEQIRLLLKEYAVVRLDCPNTGRRGKVRTVKAILGIVSRTFRSILEDCGGCFEDIRSEHIVNYYTRKGINVRSLTYIIDFLEKTAILGHLHYVNLQEIRAMKRQYDRQRKYVKMILTQNIPAALYDNILFNMNRVMRDETMPMNDRLTAGIILMESQMGLRPAELCALKKDCLHWLCCSDGKKRPYIEYNSMKEAKDDHESFLVQTICTPLLLQTIEYYLPLRQKCAYADESDFMLVFDKINGVKKTAPAPEKTNRLEGWIRRVLARHCPFTRKQWPNLRYGHHPKLGNTNYTLPTAKNFRVHFTVSLYEQGMPIDFIEAIISHAFNSQTYDSYYGTIKPKRETIELASEPFQKYFPAGIDF